MNHPKFTVITNDDKVYRYKILEFAILNDGQLFDRCLGHYKSLDEALADLHLITGEPVLVAFSSKPVDNSFKV